MREPMGWRNGIIPKSEKKGFESPHRLLISGLVLAIAGFTFTGVIIPEFLPSLDGTVASSIMPLFIALIGLFTGTIVYMRIYDYVNFKNQRRDWTRDYANRMVNDIYAPLWAETNGILTAVKRFEEASKWRGYVLLGSKYEETNVTLYEQVINSHLGGVVDERVRSLGKEFHASVRDYEEARSEAWFELYKAVEEVKSQTKHPEGIAEGNVSQLYEPFRNHAIAVYNPEMSIDEDYARKGFTSAYDPRFGPVAEAEKEFDRILASLRSLCAVVKLREKEATCVGKGERVIARINEIVKNPMASIIPDFEE
jgi:hypothetical protein